MSTRGPRRHRPLGRALGYGCPYPERRPCLGCDSVSYSPPGPGEKLTVDQVQKEIRVGMSGAEVVEVLGLPNVVTTDELRREV